MRTADLTRQQPCLSRSISCYWTPACMQIIRVSDSTGKVWQYDWMHLLKPVKLIGRWWMTIYLNNNSYHYNIYCFCINNQLSNMRSTVYGCAVDRRWEVLKKTTMKTFWHSLQLFKHGSFTGNDLSEFEIDYHWNYLLCLVLYIIYVFILLYLLYMAFILDVTIQLLPSMASMMT